MLFNFTQHHLTKTPVVLTIGNFDGFHLGHRHILQVMKQEAQKLGGATVLMTFTPNPKEFFQKSGFLGRINSPEQQREFFKKNGLDAMYSVTFDESVANVPAKEFIHQFLLSQFNLKSIVTGADFRFGKDRQGDIALLQEEGKQHRFDVKILEPVLDNRLKVSSSQIRLSISESDFQNVEKLLGRPYSIRGKVQQGLQLARTLGFPTANLSFEFKLPLQYGVYAAIAHYRQRSFHAIINWGIRPTFNKKTPLLEAYLFGFEGSLYEQNLEVIPQKQLRGEIKFDSVSDLKLQIQSDLQQAENFFRNHSL